MPDPGESCPHPCLPPPEHTCRDPLIPGPGGGMTGHRRTPGGGYRDHRSLTLLLSLLFHFITNMKYIALHIFSWLTAMWQAGYCRRAGEWRLRHKTALGTHQLILSTVHQTTIILETGDTGSNTFPLFVSDYFFSPSE